MSLGKTLLGMFVEIEESQSGATAAPAATSPSPTSSEPRAASAPSRPAGPPPVPATASHSSPPSTPRSQAGIDEAILSKLKQTLQENNRPGFDFLEFQASLAALEKVVPDEATRYRSAFATAATMGVTVPVLMESAQAYRDLLKREQQEFERELQSRQKQDVGNKQTEIERIQKDIQTASETIQRLTREIAEGQAKAQALQTQLDDAATKLSRARDRFESTVQHLDAEMLQQQKQIQTLLAQGA
jgi:FtsZ-binding cell division protein ZapB